MVDGGAHHHIDSGSFLSVHDAIRAWTPAASGNDCFQDDDWKRLPFLVSLLDFGHVADDNSFLEKKQKEKRAARLLRFGAFRSGKERSF